MISLAKSSPLTLYLASTNKCIGALLAQEMTYLLVEHIALRSTNELSSSLLSSSSLNLVIKTEVAPLISSSFT